MQDGIELIYEGRGFSGGLALESWLAEATPDDVVALMAMDRGMSYADAPFGIHAAYEELAGADAGRVPDTILFRDQAALLDLLRGRHPLLWEAASGSALRCDDTIDMFGEVS
jgi:hypothetical protein